MKAATFRHVRETELSSEVLPWRITVRGARTARSSFSTVPRRTRRMEVPVSLSIGRSEGVQTLTLERPDRLNSFTVADYRELREAVERATADSSTRALVITGTGRAFSVGADKSLLTGAGDADESARAGIEFDALLDVIGECDKPIIAAVNGLAIGFGCTLLCYCDLVIMAQGARLRLPFTALGIVPEAGSSALMATRARWSDTVWSMLSSEWIDATAAHDMGLAWKVVQDSELMVAAAGAASTIAALDPAAVAATKRLLVAGRSDAARAARQRELNELAILFGSSSAGGGT
jgi:enoyl-CoA hydratase/carnithine racemase